MSVQKKKSKIDVVGLRYNFEEVIRQINEHIDVNAIITSTIPERPVVVQYFELHLGVFGKEAVDKLKNVEIDWRTKDKRKGEVVIKGNAANVESGVATFYAGAYAKAMVKILKSTWIFLCIVKTQ